MMDNETATEYVSRARGLSVKCASAGLIVSERQLVYNVVQGLYNKFNQIREILRTQRDKKLDDILKIVKEKERDIPKKGNVEIKIATWRTHMQPIATWRTHMHRHKKNSKKKCYICGKIGHISKVCYYRKDKSGQGNSENNKKDRKDNTKDNVDKNTNYASEDRIDYSTYQAFNASTYPSKR